MKIINVINVIKGKYLVRASLFIPVLSLFLSGAAWASNPTNCAAIVSSKLKNPSLGYLSMKAVTATARGNFGFTSFSMSDYFQIEDMPLHTAPAGYADIALLEAVNNSTYATGNFVRVFPGRGNGDEDLTSFWIYLDTGAAYVRSIRWGGGWERVENTQCYAGPGNQVVITGQVGDQFGAYGANYWTFVLKESECGEVLC